jgi:hypothetical protein
LDADGLAGGLLEEGAQDAGGDEPSATCGSRSGRQQQEGDAAGAGVGALLARLVQDTAESMQKWYVNATISQAWAHGACPSPMAKIMVGLNSCSFGSCAMAAIEA